MLKERDGKMTEERSELADLREHSEPINQEHKSQMLQFYIGAKLSLASAQLVPSPFSDHVDHV